MGGAEWATQSLDDAQSDDARAEIRQKALRAASGSVFHGRVLGLRTSRGGCHAGNRRRWILLFLHLDGTILLKLSIQADSPQKHDADDAVDNHPYQEGSHDVSPFPKLAREDLQPAQRPGRQLRARNEARSGSSSAEDRASFGDVAGRDAPVSWIFDGALSDARALLSAYFAMCAAG